MLFWLLGLCWGVGVSWLAAEPLSMGLATPTPVPPWVTERMEEKFCHKNDFRTPILPPIREGFPPPVCADPPDEAQVLRALPALQRGVPQVCEESRENVQVVTELLIDKIDPPRFFPLVGPAQLHHCHWKCIVYYDEVVESGYPFPYRCARPHVQVVYIDSDSLHLSPADTARDVTAPGQPAAGLHR
jgi:hypothetical protein